MALFGGSKSSKKIQNDYRSEDNRRTDTINAGVGGDIDESTVFSGVDGSVTFNNTAGGAFETVDKAVRAVGESAGDLIEANSKTTGEAFGLVKFVVDALGEQQDQVLNAAENLAANSLNLASNIAVGESVATASNRNVKNYVRLGVIGVGTVAGIAGLAYVGGKFAGGK